MYFSKSVLNVLQFLGDNPVCIKHSSVMLPPVLLAPALYRITAHKIPFWARIYGATQHIINIPQILRIDRLFVSLVLDDLVV